MQVISSYAALLALLFVTLSVRTLRLRRRFGIPIGDGGNAKLLRAIRAHANFAEYVPLALLLTFLVQTDGPSWLVHALASSLVIGRFSHAYGVSSVDERYVFRVFGMALTLTMIATAALYLFARAVAHAI